MLDILTGKSRNGKGDIPLFSAVTPKESQSFRDRLAKLIQTDQTMTMTITPECVIMLTDGYFSGCGEWDVPILWCICGGNKTVMPVGKTVHIED